ncbi:hypothetical protein [Alicyclobacillus sp. ALC3]|uniref:hypothetical protein n=1 Tax=Alicyclobacillus sp. ALC3 TaxID=2796143 RepID=UPI002379BD05|nr:hypothetical protein [Alicyclobacillus sp. ALC3]WDL97325.1 hypothetical protein JC200_00825 [Alicyclobacillus sp. ALC3]
MSTKRWQTRIGAAAAAVFLLSLEGCGPPDLRTMQPTVHKPTAVVVFVNHPAHWNSADVENAAQQAGVEVKTVSTSSNQVPSALADAVANPKVGLVVVVQTGTVPNSELAFAKTHAKVSFALFGAQSVPNPGATNVSQVVPDTPTVSYSLGALAGDLAVSLQATSIGWLTGGQPILPLSDVRMAFAGAFKANSGVGMVSVPVTSLSAGQGVSGSTTGNSIGNSTVPGNTTAPPSLSSGSTTGATGSLPRIVVTTQSLSQSQMTTLRTAGVVLISLCEQSATGQVAGEPAVPGISAMQKVLSDYVSGRSQSSVITSATPPLITLDGQRVPSSVQNQVNSVELSVEGQASVLQSAWRGIPSQLQTTWSPIALQASGVGS